jgi:hypothetical protein
MNKGVAFVFFLNIPKEMKKIKTKTSVEYVLLVASIYKTYKIT